MIKKIFLLSIILSLCFLTFGCGSDLVTTTTTSTTTTAAATTTTTAAATTTTSTTTTTTTTTTTANPNGDITGTVILFGEASNEGAIVAVNATTTTNTDANGNYTFSGVTPATYTITVTKTDFVQETTANVAVTAATTTNVGTITVYRPYAVVASYNMNTVLTGTPTAMTCTDNNLFIFTDTPTIYKVSVTDPTTVLNEETVTATYTYYSMCVEPGLGEEILGFAFDTAGNNWLSDMFDKSNLANIDRDFTNPGVVTDVPVAISIYDDDNIIIYNVNEKAFIKMDVSGGPPAGVATYNVTATGIIGLDPDGVVSTYFACNATTIYEYDSVFTNATAKSQTAATAGGGSNLIAIAYDGTNIWTIDTTTGYLYKHLDNY